MSEPQDEAPSPQRRRVGPLALVAVVAVMAFGWGGLVLMSGRALEAPEWLTAQIESLAGQVVQNRAEIGVGSIVAVMADRRVPRILFRDLEIRNPLGTEMAKIPEVRARFSPGALLTGRVELTRLVIVGAELTLRRDSNGRFDLALGTDRGALQRPATLPEILAGIDAAFAAPALAGLTEVQGEALRLTFQDALTGRVWRAENGRFSMDLSGETRTLALNFALAGGVGDAPAEVRLQLGAARGATGLDFAANIAGIEAADIAGQVPALAWLTAARAPLSGNLRGSLGADGFVKTLDGALEIGAGAIHPREAVTPILFEGAKAYLSFDPEQRKIRFTEITARTNEAEFRASGHAYLRQVDPTSGLPGQMLVQLALSDIAVDPSGALTEPARFARGAVDLRLTLSPFRVEVGQMVLAEEDRRIVASGQASAGDKGWSMVLDAALNSIPHDRLFALWPLGLVPKTREWLVANVTEGLLTDVHAAVRLAPDEKPRLALGYSFADGTVRFLPTMPPIVGGSGHASIFDSRYAMLLDKGNVIAPTGEVVDATGSAMIIPDINIRFGPAEFRIETESTIPAALSILDEPPFEFISKAGYKPDLATGRARASTILRMPLAPQVDYEDIRFNVVAELSDVRSETLVPGHVLWAERLDLRAENAFIAIAGPGQIGQAVFDAEWRQPLGPEVEGEGRIKGQVTLNQAFLDEFGIALPEGSVTGEGIGQIALSLPKGAPIRVEMTSDLDGLGLSVPPLSWSLGRSTKGRLEVAGALTTPPTIDRIRLEAPGLLAEGSVTLDQDNGFAGADFTRVRAGGWLDAPMRLTGRGEGQSPAVEVTGGTMDMRATSLSGSSGTGGEGPITLALDRLIVTEGMVFSPFSAQLSTRGGLNGRFNGRLAGDAPVSGVLSPSRLGTAIRMQSDDAGRVLRASGLLDSARQGRLDLTLTPIPGEGRYDGQVTIADLRLRGAPVLADLLSAISVVGMLEQLSGEGISFASVTGEFTLDPRGVTLHRGSGIGVSLGISMEGIYDLRDSRMDMRGTVSPFYLVNSVGQVISRRGEGLFGFNYRMLGPVEAPEVRVNPLSILTPGMFREIFRAPPPELSD